MLPLQPTAPTATLIDRVLKLRRQLGIDIHLSINDVEDEPSMQATRQDQSTQTYNSRDWLVWSQSPACENSATEDQKEASRCQ